MAMRDSKFPGRMRRLAFPLPEPLLVDMLPALGRVQTRVDHLAQQEALAFHALRRATCAVAVSFAQSYDVTSPRKKTLSRSVHVCVYVCQYYYR